MLSMLSKTFSRWHFEISFSYFPRKHSLTFHQIISIGDDLREMSNPAFLEK